MDEYDKKASDTKKKYNKEKIMKLKILLIIAILLSLCSCAYTEPNAKFTVTAFGVSANEKTTKAYLQAIDPENSLEGKVTTFEVTGQGKSVSLALRDIKTKLSKEASFQHCQLIILSSGVKENSFSDYLGLCKQIGVPLRTKIIYTDDIEKLLTNKKITDASNIVSLLKQGYEILGFGNHSALFEIQTAVLTNKGDFALPVLSAYKDEIQISGLMKYERLIPVKRLDYEESREYAKEIN